MMSDIAAAEMIRDDRKEFFRNIFRHDIGLEELLRFYISYDGAIYADQKHHFLKKAESLLSTGGHTLDSVQLLSGDGAIRAAFLREHFPHLSGLYFSPASHLHLEKHEILSDSRNEYASNCLPGAISLASRRPRRPPFFAMIRRGGSLFVGPNQYQYFDGDEFYPAASLRAYSRAVVRYQHHRIQGQVVLVQDHADGSNFAHFSFDWLTRIMHALESGLIKRAECTFIMGGENGPFQKAMISALCALYRLSPAQFFYPAGRLVLELGGTFMFFSDQNIARARPAQLAHPRSIGLLKALVRNIQVPRGNWSQVFVSRGDAKLRKIENESQLTAIAEGRGFKTVRLSELPIEEQFATFRGARQIVAAHGMGLAHLLFGEQPLHVLELFHPTIATDEYAVISRALGFGHSFVVGESTQDIRGSYRIDVADFISALDGVAEATMIT